MHATVAIIADDLTGATDSGVGFLRAGLSTTVAWLDSNDDTPIEHCDVIAFDTRTRTAGAPQAIATTRRVVTALNRAGVKVLYKKVDSTLRGHIGEEVSVALAAWRPRSTAIVAPAFPAAGRTTVRGRQRVNGVPLEGSSISMMLEKAHVRTRLVDLALIRSESLVEAFRECRASGVAAIVCDAETNEDLQRIARAGVALGSDVVWVGSGGLASALSINLGLTGTPVRGHDAPTAGPILFAVGSTSEIARVQASCVVESGVAHVSIPIAALDGRDVDATASISREIGERLGTGEDVILTLGAGANTRPSSMTTDGRLVEGLSALVRPLANLVGGLVVTGGETAAIILRAWGTAALRLLDEVEPGVPLAVTIGARPILVVTKAGSFGNPDTLVNARSRVRAAFK